jgi:hypothetical protein
MDADDDGDATFDPEDAAEGEFEVDNMRVRVLDWAEGTRYADGSVARDSYLGEHSVPGEQCQDLCHLVKWLLCGATGSKSSKKL